MNDLMTLWTAYSPMGNKFWDVFMVTGLIVSITMTILNIRDIRRIKRAKKTAQCDIEI